MTACTSRSLDWPGTSPRPSKLAQPATSKNPPIRGAKPLLAFARLRGEVLLELLRLILVRVSVRRRRALARDVGPLHRELGVHLQPFLRLAVGVGNDGLGRALGLAHA